MDMRATIKGAVLALMLGCGSALADDSVAMITDLEGAVKVKSGTRLQDADVLMSLSAGSMLTVPTGAKLNLVYYASSKEYQFNGPDSVMLAAEAPASLSGSESKARAVKALGGNKIAPTEVQNLVQAGLQMRSIDLRKRIQLRSPVESVVIDAQPQFIWAPLEPEVQYRFSLHDEAGQAVLETLVDRTSLRLPEGTVLKPGVAYTWTVSARSRSGSDYSANARFRSATAEQRAAVASLREGLAATPSERVMLAVMLERMGLQAEADEAWKLAARDRPNSPQLKRLAAQAVVE